MLVNVYLRTPNELMVDHIENNELKNRYVVNVANRNVLRYELLEVKREGLEHYSQDSYNLLHALLITTE